MRTKLPQEETDAIINRLRTKRDNLLSELREVEFLIEASEKAAKPLSEKKLAALEKLHKS